MNGCTPLVVAEMKLKSFARTCESKFALMRVAFKYPYVNVDYFFVV